MTEPPPNVLLGDRGKGIDQRRQDFLQGPWLERPQPGFHFRPAVLYRVQIRRVRWEKQDPGPTGGNHVFELIHFLARAILPKDQVPPVQRRRQHLLDKEHHRLSLTRARHAQAGPEPCQVAGSHRRPSAPPLAGPRGADPLAGGRAAIPAGQRQVTAPFVKKDAGVSGKATPLLSKLLTLPFVPLLGAETFFFGAA
jgi:hypothetical protein